MSQSMHVRFKESWFFRNPCLPTGQPWHDWSGTNGAKWGFAMKVPGEQHPERAVQVPSAENALYSPVREVHAPPHSVRVTLVFQNT
jgi:hypothetical protein